MLQSKKINYQGGKMGITGRGKSDLLEAKISPSLLELKTLRIKVSVKLLPTILCIYNSKLRHTSLC